jgi:hypothetical protein
MRRSVLFAVALLICTCASGEALTLADVKAKSGVQLGADELKQLLSGAKVANQIPSGSTRRWENRPGGDLSASSDGRGLPTPRVFSGSGTWNVDATQTEEWCRYILKAGDKYYTFLTLDDSARAWEFEVSK